jgi:ATP-binding cassette subfamily B protein
MSNKFPFYEQLDSMDCGVACLRMIASYHGRSYDAHYLRDLTYIDREGVSLLGISRAAEYIGLKSIAAPIAFQRLTQDIPLPAIAHWENNHFIVVYKVTSQYVWVGNPAEKNIQKLPVDVFLQGWSMPNFTDTGILLLLEPMPDFLEKEGGSDKKNGLLHVLAYIKQYKGLLWQLGLGFFLVTLFQFIFPFLIQSVVDQGVALENPQFIYIILIAFLVLFFSQTFVENIRNKIILHIGNKVNANLVSTFIAKLMQLPIRYFDTHVVGDILQRVYDNKRVENLLTSTAVLALFSLSTFLAFSLVLLIFSFRIFLLFLIGTAIYFAWAYYCLNKRRSLESKRFDYATQNQNTLVQLITGIHEIKQYNVELQKRWEWEAIQKKIYDINKAYFGISQEHRIGASLINDVKNIIITIIAAQAIIDPNQIMSLGTLFAIQYILGQLNSPLEQITGLLAITQDAKISIERMSEIHSNKAKEDLENTLNVLPEEKDIHLENVSFQYNGPNSPVILKNINLHIPAGKTTAIVGSSGGGKSTLLKLILGFYAPTEGMVKLGGVNLQTISGKLWRDQYGAVLQDGYIFSDTITKNIAFGENVADKRRILSSAKIANIQSYIDKLPLGYSTIVGPDSVSGGQKQRLLIARAVYKNPEYLFLDEPTNPLDAFNEMVIMENLEDNFKKKTMVIVAQRLTTIINADHIVVIEDGEIVEQGTHDYLLDLQGAYFQMHRNQTELTVYR